MKDKNKHIVGHEKDALFLWPHVEEVPFGGTLLRTPLIFLCLFCTLQGWRGHFSHWEKGRSMLSAAPSFLGPPSCRGHGFWCVHLYPFPTYASKRLSC